jgi:hypothetical protein
MFRQRKPVGQGANKAANKISLEHKIKLKKRLAKAYKRAGLGHDEEDLAVPHSPQPEMVQAVSSILDAGSQAGPRLLTATHARPRAPIRHQDAKPDPLKAARDQQRSYKERLAEEQAKREAEMQERIARAKIAKAARKNSRRRMNARTPKGQPVLANQIDALLGRIQKSHPQ